MHGAQYDNKVLNPIQPGGGGREGGDNFLRWL